MLDSMGCEWANDVDAFDHGQGISQRKPQDILSGRFGHLDQVIEDHHDREDQPHIVMVPGNGGGNEHKQNHKRQIHVAVERILAVWFAHHPCKQEESNQQDDQADRGEPMRHGHVLPGIDIAVRKGMEEEPGKRFVVECRHASFSQFVEDKLGISDICIESNGCQTYDGKNCSCRDRAGQNPPLAMEKKIDQKQGRVELEGGDKPKSQPCCKRPLAAQQAVSEAEDEKNESGDLSVHQVAEDRLEGQAQEKVPGKCAVPGCCFQL